MEFDATRELNQAERGAEVADEIREEASFAEGGADGPPEELIVDEVKIVVGSGQL